MKTVGEQKNLVCELCVVDAQTYCFGCNTLLCSHSIALVLAPVSNTGAFQDFEEKNVYACDNCMKDITLVRRGDKEGE